MTSQNNEIPEGFKMTELGPFPEDWTIVKLGDTASFETGKRMKGGALQSGEVLSLGGEHIGIFGDINLAKPKFISKDFFETLRKGKLNTGDIIICKDGAKTGKTARVKNIQGQYMAVNEHLFIVRSQNNNYLLNPFIFFFLFSELGQSQVRVAYHGLIGGITNNDIANFVLPLPPLPEQKAIVHVLSTIQKAIEAQDKIIAAARELKKSLMHYLFTYGPVLIAEADQVPLKETEIGLVPEHWEQAELGLVSEITYGIQAAVAHLTDPSIGIPILTNINITNTGMIDISTLRYFPLPDNKRDKLLLRRGDVLFNWRSGSQFHVGKTASFDLDGDYTYSSFILRFRSYEDSLSNEYLYRYLNLLKGVGFFSSRRSQSSVNSVFNASLAAKIPVFLPPTSDQIRIAMILSLIDRKLEVQESCKAALQVLFKTMLHLLMTGKVRVRELEDTAT